MPFSPGCCTSSRMNGTSVQVALCGLLILALGTLASPLALGAVTLSSPTTPNAAQPGVTYVSVTGTGFPAGSLAPLNTTVTLAPVTNGAGPTVQGTVTSATILFGSSGRVIFQVPQSLALAAATPYHVSINGTTSLGNLFSSSNTANLTIDPQPSLNALVPASGAQGKSTSIQITGNFTSFFQGSTLASFGAGISVGGGAAGAPGLVTVTSPGSATAQIAIDAAAALGSRNVVVQTGTQKVTLTNGFTVTIRQVLVPNVVGLTQAAASTAITGAGLVGGTVTSQSSATVASGNVISESPSAGTSVNLGSSVNLVVSSGPAPVSVPNVVGLTQAAASTAITGAGLVVGTVTSQSSATVASGKVISESPSAGTSVAAGSSVNLVVSTGPAPVSVPNVVGLTQAAASTAITGAGLVVGTVTSQSSATVASGKVISESPSAGTSVAAGSSVNLVVSTGPAPVSVPNVVGLTQAAASTAITGAGLVVGTVTTQSSATVASGNVISENPSAGTSVAAGSSVNLVVSTGPAPSITLVNPNSGSPGSTNTPVTITGSGTHFSMSSLVSFSGTGVTAGAPTAATATSVTVPVSIAANAPLGLRDVQVQTGAETVNLTSGFNVASSGGTVVINLSSQVIPWGGTVTITPQLLDSGGNPITNPAPVFDFSVVAVGTTSGNAPVLSGNTIQFTKLTKTLLNQNLTVDPNGIIADTDPNDPNFGKQTGGVFTVTATLRGGTSASKTVVVLPTGTAPITAQTFTYSDQLTTALNNILTAYQANGHAGLTAAKAALQTLITTPGMNAQALGVNQVLAPPDGRLIALSQIVAAGITASPDDATFVTTLNNLHSTITAAISSINALDPANLTQAAVTAVQTATSAYKAQLNTLNGLHPSPIALANNNALLNQVMASDIPTLLDAIGSKVGAVAAPLSGSIRQFEHSPVVWARLTNKLGIAPQLFDIFSLAFGACVDLAGTAKSNIITLAISLANDIINLEVAGLVNKNAPPGMIIDGVVGSASLSFVCNTFPGSFIEGSGFSPDASEDKALLLGCVDSATIATLLTISVPKGVGQAINQINLLVSAAQALPNAFNVVALDTASSFSAGTSFVFADGDDTITFDNGFTKVNQSPIPCVGVIIPINMADALFAAINVDFLGNCP